MWPSSVTRVGVFYGGRARGRGRLLLGLAAPDRCEPASKKQGVREPSNMYIIVHRAI